ncbi:MAG: tetratricopeptide repeat protein, partial [Lewinellaceae bacterium]|nr:tetratricopeptide repeat protein [Lewinellaceae bacterium]
GLTGMADGNADKQVNLLEINRYLEETVPKETAPQTQIPMTVGSKGTILTDVDEASLLALREQKEKALPAIATIETKGFEQVVLAGVDSIWQKKYEQFTTALQKGELLEPAGASAYDLYTELSKVPELERLHGIMKRNLATALQEESQQAINAYLRADTKDLEARSRGESRYYKYVEYLEKATELLGPEHYMYKSLKAKQHYFHAVDLRVRLSSRTFSLGDSVSIWQASSKENIQKALEYESNAAYIFNEMSILSAGEERKVYLEKAIEIAPEWAIPYNNLGIYYRSIKDLEKAESCFRKAIELAPYFSHPYLNIGLNYADQKKYHEAEIWMKKAIERSPGNVQHLNSLATFYRDRNRPEEAEQLWLQVLKLNPTYIHVYNSLSGLYQDTKQYDQAEAINWKRLEVRPTDGDAYSDLLFTYKYSGQLEKIPALIKKMEHLNNSVKNWEGENILGYAYMFEKNYDAALILADNSIKNAPNSPWVHKFKGSVLVRKKEYDAAIPFLETAIDMGMNPSNMIDEIDFYELSKAKSFKSFAERLMEKMPENGFGFRMMSIYYQNLGDNRKAKTLYSKAVKLSPGIENYRINYESQQYTQCQQMVDQGDYEKALYFLDAALAAGNRDYDLMQNNIQLDPLRELAGFKALMRQYFPEKTKN